MKLILLARSEGCLVLSKYQQPLCANFSLFLSREIFQKLEYYYLAKDVSNKHIKLFICTFGGYFPATKLSWKHLGGWMTTTYGSNCYYTASKHSCRLLTYIYKYVEEKELNIYIYIYISFSLSLSPFPPSCFFNFTNVFPRTQLTYNALKCKLSP
jgi:hypothetical protein